MIARRGPTSGTGREATIDRPLVIANVSRRRFLQGVSALGGLVLAVGYPRASRADDPPKYGADGMPHGWVDNPLAFVAIADDGTVTIVCHRSEMGQGVRTGMPMIVAEELEADWKRVRVAQAPGDEERYGNQDTDGSRSTRHFFDPMRRCGAAARAMLEAAAAAQWQVPVSEVQAKNHEVVHGKTGRRLGYGALAKAAARQPVPARETLRLKDPSQFRYIGKGQLKLVDARDIATGKAQYGIDTRLDGMLYAVVARPPVYGGKAASYDDGDALKVPGVVRVVEIEGSPAPPGFNPLGGIAVIGRTTWAAMQGRKALKIGWDDGPNGDYDSAAFKATLEEAARKPGPVVRNDGDFAAGMAGAARRLEAEYYLPHLAHATMEPPAAAARIAQGKCEVWGPFQSPQAARDMVAKRLGMSAADVTVHVTLLGGGFGRKSKPDYGVEAAVLSQAMDGKPVKVTWTREDDLHHDYFHTVSVEHLEAGVDARGRPVAWLHRSVAPTIMSTFDASATQEANWELGMGVINVPFAIPNVRIENPEATAHTRIGWFRSVSNIPARVRGPVVRRRARRGGGPRPEGLPARRDRAGSLDHPDDPERHLEPRRISRALPRRHRPSAPCGGDGGARGEVGPSDAEGARAGHRGALQLRDLRGGGRRGRGRRQGRPDDPAGGHRGGLRGEHQPGPGPRADGRRVRDGARHRDIERDQLQGRPGRARQLQHLRGDPDHRDPAGDPRSHPPRGLQLAARRSG